MGFNKQYQYIKNQEALHKTVALREEYIRSFRKADPRFRGDDG